MRDLLTERSANLKRSSVPSVNSISMLLPKPNWLLSKSKPISMNIFLSFSCASPLC
ncbi:MAG: hypothetical protein E7L30_07100 [Lactococcus lactis]|uniref:Uncharacterized protein n=1 Tax=Lactococcus lactis subsp. cremoris TaxID=1359 RepID=A0AAJ6MJ35_LACLC|nr:hypothetical protein [Lactococcus cremoris]MCD6632869.1 hypothetical protein [Lactococcus cremoris]MDU7300668.1 hypothetical protein [Lactococcus lactis]WOW94059.1 hypothetical protein LLUC109_02855 [Lactococcus cremoris]